MICVNRYLVITVLNCTTYMSLTVNVIAAASFVFLVGLSVSAIRGE